MFVGPVKAEAIKARWNRIVDLKIYIFLFNFASVFGSVEVGIQCQLWLELHQDTWPFLFDLV